MKRLVADKRPPLVKETLPLPDHAVTAIVEQQHLDGDAIRARCFQFARIHPDTAVTVDVDYQRIRPRQLCANSRGQSEPHRSHAARRQKAARLDELEELRRPHLMLADARTDNG